jgi:hypothetical protein
MACATLEEMMNDCERNSGGLHELYVGDLEDIDTTVNSTTWKVTAATVDTAPVQIEIKRKTSNYTEEVAEDFVNGSTTATVTINVKHHRRAALKSRALDIIGKGQRYLYALMKDANGVWWYVDHLQLQSVGGGSGTERADGSNYDAVLVAESDQLMYEIDAAVALAIIAYS